MPEKNQCDCSRLELLEEKIENCKEEKQKTCEKERDELKTSLEQAKKKLVMFQIICAVALAILGKEGASEAIGYFTSTETIQPVVADEVKEVSINEKFDVMLGDNFLGQGKC